MATAQPTATIDDYLLAIYSLQSEGEGETAISARLARWMRVTPPTAWATVRRMERDGLVEIDRKKVIRLTPKGLELAENIARRHRLSERFLTDVLGLGWAEAHEEAHRFEHGVSPRVEELIFTILNKPTTCPHGSPIPGTGAKLDPNLVPMDSLKRGEKATVRLISEDLKEDLELLRYLERGKITPDQEITIRELVPSTGVVIIEADGQSVSLGLGVAAKIRVLPSRRRGTSGAAA
jgi:DtxR family Mn-dependent transcriptional regulator